MNAPINLTAEIATTTTLQALATQYNTTPQAILAANPNFPGLSSIGTDTAVNANINAWIIIPNNFDNTDVYLEYTPQRGDTFNSIAKAMGVPVDAITGNPSLSTEVIPPAFSLDQALPSLGWMYVNNPAYPGNVIAAPTTVTPAVQYVQQDLEATDTLSSVASLLGVTVYDILNAPNNSFLAAGFITPQGQINANQPIGLTAQIDYPNIAYPGYTPAQSLTPQALALGEASALPNPMPAKATAVTVLAQSNPALLYAGIGVAAIGALGLGYYLYKRSQK